MRLLLQNFWCCYDSAIGRRIGVATTTAEEQVIRHIIKTKDVQKYQNWELATCKQRRPIAFQADVNFLNFPKGHKKITQENTKSMG